MELDIMTLDVYILLAKRKKHNFIKFSFGRVYTKKYTNSSWELLN